MRFTASERRRVDSRRARIERARRDAAARAAAVETSTMTEEEIEKFELDTWTWLEHQKPPPDDWEGDFFWLFGGRGSGKTWAGVRHFYEHMMGPPCSDEFEHGHQGVIVAPTKADAIRSVYQRPSGLQSIDPRVKKVGRDDGTVIVFPNGAEAYVIGLPHSGSVESLRAAGNTCCAYMEEFATIPPLQAALDQLELGVRIGPRPMIIGSSTPKVRPAVRKMINDPRSFVRSGRMADNPHLEERVREKLYRKFKGTSVEAQELDGTLLEKVEGALWSAEQIANRRVLTSDLPDREPGESHEEWIIRTLGLTRVALSIDPATSGRGDETGMVVVGVNAGRRRARQAFVLEDATELLTPSKWREKAAELCERWRTPLIIVEQNRLGETARLVLQDAIPNARVHDVTASVSKAMRADPVAARWNEQCWMVDTHPKLENQMTNWVPADGDDPDVEYDATSPNAFRGSPDAIDGMVHGITELLGLGVKRKGGTQNVTGALEAGWGS